MPWRLRAGTVVLFAIVSQTVWGDWTEIHRQFREGEKSAVAGPGEAYESRRPAVGNWTAEYDLRNNHANLAGERIRVHSADTVHFRDFVITSGHSGKSSHVAFCIRLSEAVTGFDWDISGHGKDVTAGSVLAARYSLDGKTWTDAFVYPPGQSAYDPPAVTVALEHPSTVVYIGWFAEVPDGDRGWWDLSRTGALTFAPLRPAAGEAEEGPARPEPALQGSRFVPADFFGTTTHVNSELSCRLLEDLRVPNVRVDFRWSGLEPERGKYTLDPGFWTIESADLGIERGLDQLVCVTGGPEWATAGDGTFPNDESAAALEEFMFRIATRYRGKIRHWQAMNEPNMAIWKDRYIKFLKAFHAGVKRADPENKVVLCGFAGIEAAQLDAAYRLGAKDYFDIIASHSYTRPKLPEEGGYLEKIRALRDVMRKHGDDKPLWVTEMGWNGVEASMLDYMRSKYSGHRAYAGTEETQARGLARLYLLSAAVPWIERVYWFHLHQEAQYTEVHENPDYYMGLFSPWVGDQVRPKDAYFAVKTVVETTRETTYTQRIDLGERLWALAFERGSETTIALWSLDDGVTMQLADASMISEVTSMVGSPVLIEGDRLNVSGRPIYLRTPTVAVPALAEALRTSDVRGSRALQLALDLDTERTTPETPTVSVSVRNTGTLAMAVPEVALRADPDTWALDPPVLPAVEALAPGSELVRSAKAVRSDGVASGEVGLGVSATVLDGDVRTATERTIRYLIAQPRPEAFVADGDLGEWTGTGVTLGDSPDEMEIAGWAGPDDCLATWYCAADAEALYLAAEVADNTHHMPLDRPAADQMWRYDSIQVSIDVAGDAQAVSNVPQYDTENDVELGFGLSPNGPLAYQWVRPGEQPGLLELAALAIVRDGAFTRYEAVIPWSVLGLDEFPKGHWMGLNVLVNDNDGEARRGWLQWAPGMGYSKDPSQFPKVLVGTR